jgi:alpha-galactosidase
MGSHVSVCPNHQTGRTTPFETRAIVASAGTFGYELDLEKLTDEEKKLAKEQILKYKEMEHLVQSGDYYRLTDPGENHFYTLWQFVSKDKKETIVHGMIESVRPRYAYFKVKGLDPAATYEDFATGKRYSGAALMNAGLPLVVKMQDYSPIEYHFVQV